LIAGQSQGSDRPELDRPAHVTRLFRRYSLIVNGVFKSRGSQSLVDSVQVLGVVEYPNNDGFASGLLQSTTPVERDRFVSQLYQSRREIPANRAKLPGNPASKSSGASSRAFRLRRAWASKATFANGRNCCGWRLTVAPRCSCAEFCLWQTPPNGKKTATQCYGKVTRLITS